MRRINVRREELQELVWPKPRTTIAKEPGISDARFGGALSRHEPLRNSGRTSGSLPTLDRRGTLAA